MHTLDSPINQGTRKIGTRGYMSTYVYNKKFQRRKQHPFRIIPCGLLSPQVLHGANMQRERKMDNNIIQVLLSRCVTAYHKAWSLSRILSISRRNWMQGNLIRNNHQIHYSYPFVTEWYFVIVPSTRGDPGCSKWGYHVRLPARWVYASLVTFSKIPRDIFLLCFLLWLLCICLLSQVSVLLLLVYEFCWKKTLNLQQECHFIKIYSFSCVFENTVIE